MKKLLKIGLTRIEKIILWLLIYLPRLKKNTDEVILLRTDNIGDYILFRNLLPFIRDAEQYRNRRLIMIGNIAWSNLAEHFDHQFIDKFIWIDTPRYQQSRIYRLTIFLKMFSFKTAELINTVHSRSYLINDLTLLCRAKKRISSFGDSINLPNEASKQASDSLFNVLLPSLSNTDFEFYRNKTFVEHLIGQPIELLKPNFNEIKKEIKPLQILIFPSAHSTLRRWDTVHFATLISYIAEGLPDYEFLILGNKSDFYLGESIIEKLPIVLKIKNLCGKTSLIELVGLIAESRILISNETSSVHIAAAVGTPTICISNGERFKRFSPYPINMAAKITYFFPNEYFHQEENSEYLAQKLQYSSDLDINQIKPETVLPAVISMLKNEKYT